MNWRFTILDRDNVATEIEDPAGWDACDITVKRDLEKHGIIFDYSGNDFLFYGEAGKLIKAEYDTYGIEGNLVLIIQLDCDGVPEELYRGRLLFTQYKFNCGDECFVRIPIETTGDVMAFTNRFDQKVDLQTAVAFDEVTALVPYARLPFDMTLPSKGIFLQDSAKNENISTASFLGVTGDGSTNDSEFGMVSIGLDKTVASEIGSFSINSTPEYDWAAAADGTRYGTPAIAIESPPGVFNFIWPSAISPIINYAESFPNWRQISNPVQIAYRLKGRFTSIASLVDKLRLLFMRLPGGADGDIGAAYEYISSTDILVDGSPGGGIDVGESVEFDISYSSDFTLGENDRLYLFICSYHFKTGAQILAADNAFSVEFDVESFFKLTDLSRTAPTISKMFLVNEALSRITEAITDNKIKAYSEYFGRTDSEPYSHDEDGCGSLEAITKGLFIRRQENRIPDQPFLFTISMKDMWEGLDPIHHIGFGIEPDTNREGFNRLRIEPWKYFYKSDIILVCDGVNKIERKTNETEHFSTFKFGYEKWEAEEYNGLDEFLTKRGYRTTLSQVKNELSKLSKMIASGYAWEITRRKGDIDSKDWRYDNDTFIACIERFSRTYSNVFTGDFLVTSFYTNVDPAGLLPGDAITITGSSLNDGDYILDFITDFGGGFWAIYFTTSVTPESGATITIDLLNPGFQIELGNVIDPLNIIDPDTLYNYRISPIRNALRWMDKILASYKHFTAGSKILFSEGEGNYYAAGFSASPFCLWENNVLAENATLDQSIFLNPDKAVPLLAPERIEFDYPMSLADFKDVMANPYGIIQWSNDCESGDGWIDTVSYKPEDGMAKFILIPKYPQPELEPCLPITDFGGMTLPDGVVGVPYFFNITDLPGDPPFILNIASKPAWMSIIIIGGDVEFSGTPDEEGTAISVAITIFNCGLAFNIDLADTFDVTA
jgi:hypothetical protein